MKKTIYIFIFIIIVSCKKKINYYHGVVVDESFMPVANVIVKEVFRYPQFAISKENGYFKLDRSTNVVSDLIFTKKGYIADTVKTVLDQYGEKIEYRFLNKKSDTIVLKKEKVF